MATEVGVPCVCVFVFLRFRFLAFPCHERHQVGWGENQTTSLLLLGICCENVALRIEGASCILPSLTSILSYLRVEEHPTIRNVVHPILWHDNEPAVGETAEPVLVDTGQDVGLGLADLSQLV